jgi:two-component system nitrogen regulation response regulator GlnG
MQQGNNKSIKGFLSTHLKDYFALHKSDSPESGLYELIMLEVEKTLIAETMIYTNGVQAKAAQILGISRNTLRKKIENLQL